MASGSVETQADPGQRAADELFNKFEAMIQSGELPDGAPLPPEREIVERYGISRTVVREAILALSNKGLVEARPRFRPVVRKPSFDTALDTIGNVVTRLLEQGEGVKNLFDMRVMVEVALARQAATDANRDDIYRLKQALEENETAINDMDRFFETDIKFHRIMYEMSGNPILPAVHRAYITWLQPNWVKMPTLPSRNQLNFESHTAIYNAILMRDPDQAEVATRKHLADAWDQINRILMESD
ncbi:MAG: FCD domain-containing protein [Rhizobiaceae bacterium]|nr:FCD domain-containing protein [Rhizobiaceae bacterium]